MAVLDLRVLIAGVPAGTLHQDAQGIMSFAYDDTYRGAPLSLSMPVSNRTYTAEVLTQYQTLKGTQGALQYVGALIDGPVEDPDAGVDLPPAHPTHEVGRVVYVAPLQKEDVDPQAFDALAQDGFGLVLLGDHSQVERGEEPVRPYAVPRSGVIGGGEPGDEVQNLFAGQQVTPGRPDAHGIVHGNKVGHDPVPAVPLGQFHQTGKAVCVGGPPGPEKDPLLDTPAVKSPLGKADAGAAGEGFHYLKGHRAPSSL